VTLGLHRLVSHRSFVVPVWLERVLVIMGTLACQSGPIEWVGLHRHHHRFSDQPKDHHDAGRGLWWSHSEWMLHEIPALQEIDRYAGFLPCRKSIATPVTYVRMAFTAGSTVGSFCFRSLWV